MSKISKVANQPITFGHSMIHTLVIAVGIGIVTTCIIGLVFKSSYPNIDSNKQYQIVCASVGASNITESAYGLPLPYLKTFDNSCAHFANEWQPIGLIVDVAVTTAAAFGLIHLLRRFK